MAGVSISVERAWRRLGLWLVVVAGCADQPAPAPLGAAQFPIAFVGAACARMDACCAGRLGATSPTDQPRCEATNEFSAALLGDLAMAVSSGRAAYDAQKAERCLQAIPGAACDTPLDVTRADAVG